MQPREASRHRPAGGPAHAPHARGFASALRGGPAAAGHPNGHLLVPRMHRRLFRGTARHTRGVPTWMPNAVLTGTATRDSSSVIFTACSTGFSLAPRLGRQASPAKRASSSAGQHATQGKGRRRGVAESRPKAASCRAQQPGAELGPQAHARGAPEACSQIRHGAKQHGGVQAGALERKRKHA